MAPNESHLIDTHGYEDTCVVYCPAGDYSPGGFLIGPSSGKMASWRAFMASSSRLSTADICSTLAFRVEMCSRHRSHLTLLKPLLTTHNKDVNVLPMFSA